MLKKPSLNISKAALIFSTFSIFASLASCAHQDDNQISEIRIVDLNGNPKPIKRIIPEGNARILANQRVESALEEQDLSADANIAQNNHNIENDSLISTNNVDTDNVIANFNNRNVSTGNIEALDNSEIKNLKSEQKNTSNTSSNRNLEAAISYDMSSDLPNHKIQKQPNQLSNTTNSSDKKFKFVRHNTNSENTDKGLKQQNYQVTYKIKSQTKSQLNTNSSTPKQTESAKTIYIFNSQKPTSAKPISSKLSNTSNTNSSIQIGTFPSFDNAKKALNTNKNLAQGSIKEVNVNRQKNYRVVLGPFSDEEEARNILQKTKDSGYKDALIIK